MRWFESSYPSYTLPAWRNWQTRWTQNPVSARTCRFDPGRRYSIKDKVFEPCLFFFVVCRVTNFFRLFVNCSGLMKSYNLERTKLVLSFFKIIIFLSLILSMFVIKFNCSIRFFLMRVWSLFHYRSYGAFFYNKTDSIIPTVVLPTTEIIEPISISVFFLEYSIYSR